MKDKNELTPPDLNQCQAERREGSFMSFGIPPLIRCANKPTWIATEKEPNPQDGLIGSMSLCDECHKVLEKKKPGHTTFKRILAP